MKFTEFQSNISKLIPGIEAKFNESFAKHTSLKIGGNAEVMVFPKSVDELKRVLIACKTLGISPRILGAGTNILASDDGVSGMTICLKDCLSGMEVVAENRVEAYAGVTLTRLAMFAMNQGLSGLEFAHGIPGTVGGGVYMNAGAYGGEIASVCKRVWIMYEDGDLYEIPAEKMEFSYRHSILEDRWGIVVKAEFELTPKETELIREKMREYQTKRSASQPLDLPSAGSAFKRPRGGYAAALIDESGLKGFRVGGAAISTKHAGFAVNLGGATAADMLKLLNDVSDRVYDRTGIRLDPEIRLWLEN